MLKYKCNCSERPMGIISAKVVMEENVPYQQLEFACTNKNCALYQKPIYRQKINLLDNITTVEEKID